jgi:hypothetical protein
MRIGLIAPPQIQAFIQRASVAHLDASCVAAIPAPAFPVTLQSLAAGG